MIEMILLLFIIWPLEIIGKAFAVSWNFWCWLIKWMVKICWYGIKWTCQLIFYGVLLVVYFIWKLIAWIFHLKQPQNPIPLKTQKSMTGLEFERYCAELLMKNGYKEVIVTPPSGDYGADLIAYDRKGNRWVFQCKHYKGKVSNSAVQEVVAAKAHYQANRAAVMTNSKLTAQARQLALENEIELFEMLSD